MEAKLNDLVKAGTAVVADVFDTMGRVPPVIDNSLFMVNGAAHSGFAGPAYTITGKAHTWTEGGDRAKLAAIDQMPTGVVAVWAGNDAHGVCCFGDLLAAGMRGRGCRGVVVDGGIRDIAVLKTMDMPILARYRTPAQAIGRWRVTAHQVPVQVRGALEDEVTVNPGDIVVVDEDGGIVVPQEMLDEVVEQVIRVSETESSARQEIYEGLRLLDALDKYGHL